MQDDFTVDEEFTADELLFVILMKARMLFFSSEASEGGNLVP